MVSQDILKSILKIENYTKVARPFNNERMEAAKVIANYYRLYKLDGSLFKDESGNQMKEFKDNSKYLNCQNESSKINGFSLEECEKLCKDSDLALIKKLRRNLVIFNWESFSLIFRLKTQREEKEEFNLKFNELEKFYNDNEKNQKLEFDRKCNKLKKNYDKVLFCNFFQNIFFHGKYSEEYWKNQFVFLKAIEDRNHIEEKYEKLTKDLEELEKKYQKKLKINESM